jgi:hypothetical protein
MVPRAATSALLILAACSADQFTASTDASVDAVNDVAPPDATPADTGPPPGDAGSDVVPFTPPTPLDCTVIKALLCADFESAPFPAPFTLQTGNVSLGTTGYSPSHALQSALAKTIGADAATLAFQTTDPGGTTKYRLSFSFMVQQIPKIADLRIGVFTFPPAVGPGVAQYGVIASGAGDKASLVVKTGSGITSAVELGPCGTGTWHHVAITATILGNPSVTVTYDGATPTIATNAGLASTTDLNRGIAVGAQRSVGGDSALVLVDDVLFTAP